MANKVVVSRVFDAPIEDVWKLWTEPELVKQWWGPDKFTCPVAEIDFRVGGTSKVCMVSKEYGFGESYSIWHYLKIEPFTVIEFMQNLANSEGQKQKPTDLGMPPDFPEDIKTTVTLKSLPDGKTEMTVAEDADFGQMSHFAKLGLEQCFEKMAAALN